MQLIRDIIYKSKLALLPLATTNGEMRCTVTFNTRSCELTAHTMINNKTNSQDAV